MNWDDVSDFEINQLLHKTKKAIDLDAWISWVKNQGRSESSILFGENVYTQHVPDYCNLWAYMGPLIFRENLDVVSPNSWDDLWSVSKFNFETLEFEFECENANPLRAAAIVYLMMNGVKPEDCKC
ncbi:MAG: phage protein NinX family protein [Marinomonas gallaica]